MSSTTFLRRGRAGVPAVFGLLLLAGCGTYHIRADSEALDGGQRPEAWNGTITVASSPAGARCTVTRDGAEVASIAATPANLQLARGNSPVTVSCAAPGRMDTTATLRPHRDFGVHHHQATGPVGAVERRRDIETGRHRRFYDHTVAMPPASFASAGERDAWFSAEAQKIRAYWAPHIARAGRNALATTDSAETLTGYMNSDLAALDSQRAVSVVGPVRRGR
jgi:hypothetical protein